MHIADAAKLVYTMFKEILKASRNNQASIFAFTFKFKLFRYTIFLFATKCKKVFSKVIR